VNIEYLTMNKGRLVNISNEIGVQWWENRFRIPDSVSPPFRGPGLAVRWA